MEPLLKKLIEEKTDLLIKVTKLETFQKTNEYKSLNLSYQKLLDKQLLFMKEYLMILKNRISYHKG